MHLKFETASEEHIEEIVSNMTRHVADELLAMYAPMSLQEILSKTFKYAELAEVAYINGELVCVMGVTVDSKMSTVARPWLIPTKTIKKYKKTFLPASKRWIAYLLTKYDALENVGSATHDRALRWLKWLGFKTGPVTEWNGKKYVAYRMEKE